MNKRRLRIREEALIGYLFLLPTIAVLAFTVGYPTVAGVWYSFSDKMIGFPKTRFVGLHHYVELLGQPEVHGAIFRTFVYAGAAVAVKLPLGIAVALLLNESFRGRGLVRGIVLLPWSLPLIVGVLIWSWMYNDLFGVFNFLLMKSGLLREPLNFLGSRELAMPSVVLVNIWRGFPFFAINLLAGLQAIPLEHYEAARVDGASRLQSFLHVTLPGLRTVMLIVALLSFIWTANDFTSIWVLTRGGPGTATEIFPITTYKLAFIGLQLGKAAAIPIILMPFFSVLIALLTRTVSRREMER